MGASYTGRLLVFLAIFIFLYAILAGGMIYVFAEGSEPVSTNTPPEPSGNWWEQLGFVYTMFTWFIGLSTGWSNYGMPSPMSWIFAGLFWICCACLILLILADLNIKISIL